MHTVTGICWTVLSGRTVPPCSGGKNVSGDLGSVGIGWNFHNEKFMLGQNVISQLKFRVSWGFTGSVNFPAYAGATTYKYQTDGRYLDFVPATLMGLGNTKLKWQQTQKWNYGVDLGLFKGRVTANFNYYPGRPRMI